MKTRNGPARPQPPPRRLWSRRAEQNNAAEPSVPQIPAQEEPPAPAEPDTVTLMALGDNLIHNTVYWSAETEDGRL